MRLQVHAVRVVLFLLVIGGKAWAADEFQGLTCGADVPKKLIGKKDTSDPAAAVEQRHQDLKLKNLGGSDVSDALFLASWQICGQEYELLINTKSGLIRDVLLFPEHSKKSPMFIGTCHAGVTDVRGTIVAVLDNGAGHDARDDKLAQTMLKATAAWRVDASREKFVPQPLDNLQCPLGGVVTQDGGP